jgi:hypothetical protein
MQSVVTNIKANGATINWTADHTKHAHIEVVKDPARSSNNQKYEEQICHNLNHSHKCHQFDLTTAIQEAQVKFGTSPLPHFDDELNSNDKDIIFPKGINVPNQIGSSTTLLDTIHTVSNIGWMHQIATNYFKKAANLIQDYDSNTSVSFRTFMAGSRTVIHVNHEPYLRRTSINEIASRFHILDLVPSLAHFLMHVTKGDRSLYKVGGCRPLAARAGTTSLPFQKLEVWQGLCIQSKDYHDPHIIHPPQTLCASPLTKEWPLGRFDTALINIDPDKEWPQSKITGSDSQFTIFLPLTHSFRTLYCSDLTSFPHYPPFRLSDTFGITHEFIPCICSTL